MTTKEQLHHLVDQLPEREIPTAQRILEALRDTSDPVARLLDSAPMDDEPLTNEDRAAIEEGREQVRRGEVRAWAEVRRDVQSG